MVRNPVVAGQFYPGERDVLSLEVEKFTSQPGTKKEDCKGIVMPHAGYVYSGAVAGATIASTKPKSVYIIIGPNHTGLGSPFSLSASDSWRTPLGEVKINSKLTETILKNCSSIVSKDELSHIHEHSIEVQLPFLQKLCADFTFVPIVATGAGINTYRKIGGEIADSIKELALEKDAVIIASSDMTHYEPFDSAKEKDSQAIAAILKLDEEALIKRVQEMDITMCGFAPCAIMIAAVKKLGAKSARLVKYSTSAEASGDTSSVVGYAGIIIK